MDKGYKGQEIMEGLESSSSEGTRRIKIPLNKTTANQMLQQNINNYNENINFILAAMIIITFFISFKIHKL